jgi:hypothetical protein
MGLSTYQGDIVKPIVTFKELNISYGLNVHLHKNSNFAYRGFLCRSKMSGTDQNWPERSPRNFSFESDVFVLGAGVEYTLFGKKRDYDAALFTKTFSPYFFLGAGMLYVNPKAEGLPDASEDFSTNFSKINPMVPFGAGIKLDVNKRFSIRGELMWFPAFTDYLDGVSKSGRSDTNDWFSHGGICFTYWLN